MVKPPGKKPRGHQFARGGSWQTVSYKLMILCKDIYALLHASVVDRPKHVKVVFFYRSS